MHDAHASSAQLLQHFIPTDHLTPDGPERLQHLRFIEAPESFPVVVICLEKCFDLRTNKRIGIVETPTPFRLRQADAHVKQLTHLLLLDRLVNWHWI
jgi:hypothetical protein